MLIFRSVYDRVLNNDNRTNNICESAHRRLQTGLAIEKPTIWKFIEGLKFVQKAKDKVHEEFVRGDEPSKKRIKYLRADEKIKSIVLGGFVDRTPVEFLRGLAANFSIA